MKVSLNCRRIPQQRKTLQGRWAGIRKQWRNWFRLSLKLRDLWKSISKSKPILLENHSKIASTSSWTESLVNLSETWRKARLKVTFLSRMLHHLRRISPTITKVKTQELKLWMTRTMTFQWARNPYLSRSTCFPSLVKTLSEYWTRQDSLLTNPLLQEMVHIQIKVICI